ncbi:hypothetical protein MMC10_007242 [Thelotrema lepadinum]|nr:hypothetical protein [Thelotrema lepadinum]
MDGLYGNNFQADPTDNVESSKDGDIETDDRVGQIYCKKCRQSEIPLCDERKLEVERLWLCGHFGPSSMRMNGTDLDLYLLTNHHKTSGRPGTPAPEESDENDEFLDCSSKCSDFSERHKSFTPQESDESDEDLDCSSECSSESRTGSQDCLTAAERVQTKDI